MITDDLNAVMADIWDRLGSGAKDRHSAFHTPVVASCDHDGTPQQRVMVMRAADQATRKLRFHTDIRTPKVDQIGQSGPVSMLGYDPATKIQIRAYGVGQIEADTPAAEAAWAAASPSSRRCYLAPVAPGRVSSEPTSGLPEHVENRVPDLAETLAGRPNFAILHITLERLEWLYLASDGHRRAAFHWHNNGWQGQWLTP
jgi:pyridoxamine 5'-phosphate oxidase